MLRARKGARRHISGILVVALVASTISALGTTFTSAEAATPRKFGVGDFSVVEGNAGKRTAKFWVTLSDPTTVATSVKYSVTAGTAASGTDFKTKSGKLVFGAGVTKKAIGVLVLADATDEPNETYNVILSAPAGGPVLGRAAAMGTIIDDDPGAGVRAAVGDASVVEGDTGKLGSTSLQVPITLSNPATATSRVSYAVTAGTASAGTDFTPVSKTLSFRVGQYKKLVTIKVNRDVVGEANETINIALTSPVGVTISRASGVARILDDDLAATTTSLITSANPSMLGASLTLTASVSSLVGTPTGSVSFFDGPVALGSSSLSAGTASIATSSLQYGMHSLTATYAGSTTHAASTSALRSQRITVSAPDALSWGANNWGQGGAGGVSDVQMSPAQLGTATWNTVAAAGFHSHGIASDGTLWSWGENAYGVLGDGTFTNRTAPVQVGSATWGEVATGNDHSLAVRADGTLWAWGRNNQGQLGDGTTTDRSAPVQIGSATNWASVSAGGEFTGAHSLAVKTDGTLWAWGRNDWGQVGNGTTTDSATPVQVGSATNWATASAGGSHSVAVRTDGTLWSWGHNSNGQLGNGSVSFVAHPTPAQVGSATTWSDISAGSFHTLAVRANGTMWGWGDNGLSQLGDGTVTTRTSPVQIGAATNWAAVASGHLHSVATRSDGTLWAWGLNTTGQLGDGTTTNRTTPVQVGSATSWSTVAAGAQHSAALTSSGTLWTWGEIGDPYAQTGPRAVSTSGPWSSIASGAGHTLAVKANGTLWAWGFNLAGQIGDASTTNRATPVQIGGATNWATVAAGNAHSLATRTDGTLWAWGNNSQGQIGDGTTTTRTAPVQIGTATNWATAAAGPGHSFGIRTNGTLWAWGDNAFNQLGDGTTTDRTSPVQIGAASSWSTVDGGGGSTSHSVAIRTNGTLWAWGNNADGQLGDGTTISRSTPVQIGTATNWAGVSAGTSSFAFSLGVRTNGTLWAWGDNVYGQLGDGTTTQRNAPVQLGSATTWVLVAAGGGHSLAARANGTLWGWGNNTDGQLGNGTRVGPLFPTQIDSGTTWRVVAAGGNHTSALR